MAHLLNTDAVNQGMIWTGQKPWHGLGLEIQKDDPALLNVTRCVELAGTHMEIEKKAVMVCGGKKIPDKFALIRKSDSAFFGLCDNKYKIPNREAIYSFIQRFIDQGKMQIETHMGLDDNGIICFLLKPQENSTFEIGSGDVMYNYVMIAIHARLGKADVYKLVNERVVCHNTYSIAITEQSPQYSHRKSATFDSFTEDKILEILGLSQDFAQGFKESAQFLAAKAITEQAKKDYFKALFPSANKNDSANDLGRVAEKLVECFDTQPGANMSGGTYWTAFNAVTYYLDHHAARSQDNRLKSAYFGPAGEVKNKAFKLALAA